MDIYVTIYRYGVSTIPLFSDSKTKVHFEFSLDLPQLYTRIKKDYDAIYLELQKFVA